jgi:hypothetical protein
VKARKTISSEILTISGWSTPGSNLKFKNPVCSRIQYRKIQEPRGGDLNETQSLSPHVFGLCQAHTMNISLFYNRYSTDFIYNEDLHALAPPPGEEAEAGKKDK